MQLTRKRLAPALRTATITGERKSARLTCAATMRTTLCLALLLKPGAFGLGVYLMNSASLRVCSPMDPGVADVTLAPMSCGRTQGTQRMNGLGCHGSEEGGVRGRAQSPRSRPVKSLPAKFQHFWCRAAHPWTPHNVQAAIAQRRSAEISE